MRSLSEEFKFRAHNYYILRQVDNKVWWEVRFELWGEVFLLYDIRGVAWSIGGELWSL